MAKRETEAAQARSDARQVRHIHERPRRLGGTTDYSTTVNQKQKAVTGASKGLEVQVTYSELLLQFDLGQERCVHRMWSRGREER